ncbi:hypothetical protein VTK26DRAFT_40 [Humicola hyalothermophila]
MTASAVASLSPSQPPPDGAPYIRLHVTPLDAELLKVILSATLLPKARNISYHAIETFPEKRYGFLELPNEDADKLRKKLNGAVLKGVKIRIERARPPGIPTPLGEAAMAKDKASKKADDTVWAEKDRGKKRKRDAEVVGGVVLENGRKIKRGWTTAEEPKDKRSKKEKDKKGKDKKKQPKSKYTDHAECLVKTVLPPNVAAPPETPSTPARKRKGGSREVIVHEFEKTTKFPTFLKTTAVADTPSAPLQFVDGQGWVDEKGNVVEAVKTRPSPPAKVLLSVSTKRQGVSNEEDATSSSDEESVAESEPKVPAAAANDNESPAPVTAESEASSPSSLPSSRSPPPRPSSSSSITSLSVKIPPRTPKETKVHPLEALYKRPRQTDAEEAEPAPAAPGFSFFGDGNDESAEGDEDASEDQVPLTPFTRQDLELRGIRSAAPTPDTAHPDRRYIPWERDEEDRKEEDRENEDLEADGLVVSNGGPAQDPGGNGKPTSDFQKWFWENRGDLNRSWKRRRKLAGKEKRYRENKARMARAI